MFAIIELGGTQFKVSEGSKILTNRLQADKGEKVTIDHVLLVENDNNINVGSPLVEKAKVMAKVLSHPLGDKVVAFKYRRRKDSASKKGHRQKLTELEIEKIDV